MAVLVSVSLELSGILSTHICTAIFVCRYAMITYSRVRELFDYRYDGKLIRRTSIKQAKKGDVVGSYEKEGYLVASVDNKQYRLHRLIWLWHKGWLPKRIDHRNGVRDYNVILNLRPISLSGNQQNSSLNSRNTSGFTGVTRYKYGSAPAWSACINVNKKFMRLGNYNSKLEAALARYTCEIWHKDWKYNDRNLLVEAIKDVWPEFTGE